MGVATAAMVTGLASTASATNGYFSSAYGTIAQGLAGATTALPQSAAAAATNPAGMSVIGNQVDIGLKFFSPNRGYTANNDAAAPPCTGCLPPPSLMPGAHYSEDNLWLVPNMGFNYRLDEASTIGVGAVVNGGLATRYEEATFRNFAAPDNLLVAPGPVSGTYVPAGFDPDPSNPQPNNINPNGIYTASDETGVELVQVLANVSYAREVFADQHLGISPILAVQRFKAYGLEPFKAVSWSPDSVTNRGYDYSIGGGVRVGYYGEFLDGMVNLGASYQTKLWMTPFQKYKGLFADEGQFDVPPTVNAGISVKPLPELALSFEYQRMFYEDVPAISNSNNVALGGSTVLGIDGGLGFGWQDMDVFKFGAQYAVREDVTLRMGYSYSTQFAPEDANLFNILAPATVQNHLSFGASWQPTQDFTVHAAFTHAFENSVEGNNVNTSSQTWDLHMNQNMMEVGISYAF